MQNQQFTNLLSLAPIHGLHRFSLVFDLPDDISTLGIQSLIHLAPRIEDSADTHLSNASNVQQIPQTSLCTFSFLKDSLGGESLQHGVWVDNKAPQVFHRGGELCFHVHLGGCREHGTVWEKTM